MTRTSNPGFEEGTLNHYVISPDEIKPGDRFGYKVVAVVSKNTPFWTAYFGPTSWSDDRVQREGDTLSEDKAKAMFPSIVASGKIYYY